MIAKTPKPPYYAVIFSSIKRSEDMGYAEMGARMMDLALQQKGFLGVESAREDLGITVSYWRDLDSIKQWKQNIEHIEAQQQGKKQWYDSYRVRVAKVEKEYGF